jgi:FAD:protein FMN transferase
MAGEPPGTRRVEHVMGMPIVVDVRDDPADCHRVLDEVFGWFRRVDAVFSTYRPDSEISRINRGELSQGEADPDVRFVIGRCEELRDETGGYFDVRAASPDFLEPSGLVKGWAVDRAAEILDAAGLRNYAVNAGGDIRLRGGALPEPVWRVGIEHPRQPGSVAKVIEADDLAVATSGEYARGQHVVDPHSRRPPDGLLSVTITGPDLATADAYATAVFAMGAKRAVHWTARLEQYEALSILADGRVLSTVGFPSLDVEGLAPACPS